MHIRLLIVVPSMALCLAGSAVAATPVIRQFEVNALQESKLPDNAPAPARCPALTLTRAGDDALIDAMVKLYRFELRLSDGSFSTMKNDVIVFRPPAQKGRSEPFNPQDTPRCPKFKMKIIPNPDGFLAFDVSGKMIGRFSAAANMVPDTTGMKNLSKKAAILHFPFKAGEPIESFELSASY
jgi:hypothetical protein